ncbi:hypothetical protein P12x_000751 [Tundrisphaera lichenicola]|uniref:hypothetical protein n=1 Tax=Tundrisphaera lichenicola TaxID=2029860 RepID=UPI003EB83325
MFAVAILVPTSAALGQGDATDPLSKILTDPEKLEELKKDKLRAPIEVFRSQILPNDILPYLKANHWAMAALEMRANHDDYEGSLVTRPVGLADQPHEMFYRRDARLIKGQRVRLTLPIFLPLIPKELGIQLVRPEAIREDIEWPASLRTLEPHQQMVVVLSKDPNDPYARWSQFHASLPSVARRDDPLLLEKQRYYRMVLPLEPDKPYLSAHPLTWSAISHVIWDGLSPELLGVGQQQAMLDWLHWGGQLVIVGGAGPSFAPLRESFLAPYLPAEPSGENVMRSGADLKALSNAYPPPTADHDPDDPIASNIDWLEGWKLVGRRYRDPAPIPSTEKKPLFIAALKAKPGATEIPLGGPEDPPLGVEWRVGRGRVLMLAVGLTDPDLLGWPGYDTLVRRVVLRRPEEPVAQAMQRNAVGEFLPPRYGFLQGPDLTGVRYLSRDLGAPARKVVEDEGQTATTPPSPFYTPPPNGQTEYEVPVGEWIDTSALPMLSREKLEQASGIEIPGRAFVLKVILAYILALVPLNYLVCRYLIGRREWAWVVVPLISLAFAIGVERAAAYDVGYDSSSDEIDLLETHGDYPRGHLSRFGSVYSTGRVQFSISYPNDPTALALPLSTGRALRGEEAAQSSFQSLPFPALTGFQVQPRSLALYRAEQMASLPGTITLSPEGEGPRSIVNESGLDINDAWVVELRPGREDDKLQAVSIGAIPAGGKVPLGTLDEVEPQTSAGVGQLEPGPFLDLLLSRTIATRPEEVGELRLIGWASKPLPGQTIEPPVDRLRGFTLVVAHLRPAPLLDPASPRYFALAQGQEKPPAEPPIPAPDPNQMFRGGRGMPGLPGMGGGATIVVPAPAPVPQVPSNPDPEAPPTDPNSNEPEIPRP